MTATYAEFYFGLYNFGCDPVFTWCPSKIPVTLKYASLKKDCNAGVFAAQGLQFQNEYVSRGVGDARKFVCESK
jgi:hypothetical protein